MINTIKVILLSYAIGLLTGIIVVKYFSKDTVITEQVVVYKPVPVKMVKTRYIPYKKVEYHVKIKTDTVFVVKPANLDTFNLVSTNPLLIRKNKAFLTYWNPRTQFWNTDIYKLPQRKLFLESRVGFMRESPFLSISIGYKKISFDTFFLDNRIWYGLTMRLLEWK